LAFEILKFEIFRFELFSFEHFNSNFLCFEILFFELFGCNPHDSLEKLLTEISTLISTEILVHTTQIPNLQESVAKLKSFGERLEIDIQFIRPLIEEEIAATRNSLRLSREDLINKIRQIEKRIDFIMIKIDGSETEV